MIRNNSMDRAARSRESLDEEANSFGMNADGRQDNLRLGGQNRSASCFQEPILTAESKSFNSNLNSGSFFVKSRPSCGSNP